MHYSNTLTSLEEWQQTAAQFTQKVRTWTEPHRKRKGTGIKHPVYDFLFSYYSYPMGKLETWHPGLGHVLESPQSSQNPDLNSYNHKYYRHINGSIFLDPTLMEKSRIPRLRWIQQLLQSIQDRPANFACFGLHEWAMVYNAENVRHGENAPLRLGQEETNSVLKSKTIRCSHYDAYRFFSSSAHSMNRLNPTQDNRHEYEQSGCLHTNMDLYKWCYKAMPWISSDLLWKCFELAREVRELDMRASPYDLTEFNISPVKIETKLGREEYENLQRALSQKAAPIRKNLIEKLDAVLNLVDFRIEPTS